MALPTLDAWRVVSGRRRGSSRPVVVDTADGRWLVKLRGSAQGAAVLVAEIVVGALADALGIAVPARALVTVPSAIEIDGGDDELAAVIRASEGVNLGFRHLDAARDATPFDIARVDRASRAAILWLDRLVLNPDRTVANPNLLWWNESPWLIDNGAALPFQYDWLAVSEESPRKGLVMPEPHLFDGDVSREELLLRDELLAARLTRDVLERAIGDVPDQLLMPLVAASDDLPRALTRRRAAYVAFLWKRLAAPRPFLDQPIPLPRARGTRPSWLRP